MIWLTRSSSSPYVHATPSAPMIATRAPWPLTTLRSSNSTAQLKRSGYCSSGNSKIKSGHCSRGGR
jgi:hypothetical protein